MVKHINKPVLTRNVLLLQENKFCTIVSEVSFFVDNPVSESVYLKYSTDYLKYSTDYLKARASCTKFFWSTISTIRE